MKLIWNDHVKNRNEFPLEELQRYAGQHVAWSLDGKRILAGDTNPLELVAKLQAAGYTAEDCVLSFVDEFEELQTNGLTGTEEEAQG